jgi:hypothetical protein
MFGCQPGAAGQLGRAGEPVHVADLGKEHRREHSADPGDCLQGGVAAGHAFVQNLRHGHYEIAADQPARHRLAIAFRQLATGI